MKLSALLKYHWLIALIVATTVISTEARGGRRGGSTLGGLLGGLRKHKKHPSGGNSSRRTINGSPMHVSQSVTSAHQSRVRQHGKNGQRPASYPRQTQTGGHIGGGEHVVQRQHFHTQHHVAPHYTAQHPPPLPPGGVYYVNHAALPSHAVYYPQPPVRSTAPDADDFLTGVIVGNALTHRHTHHEYHHHHHHRQQQQQQQKQTTNDTATTNSEAPIVYTPPAADTPLAPFNTSITPVELIQTHNAPIYPPRQQQAGTTTPDATQPPTPTSTVAAEQSSTPMQQQTAPSEPIYGIICLTMLLNETDPTDASKVQTVEKLVCYPAPPPPPPQPSTPEMQAATMQLTQLSPHATDMSHGLNAFNVNTFQGSRSPAQPDCVMRTFVERDPSDASKTIEVQREYCTTAATQKVQVAGEINEHENAAVTVPSKSNSPATTTATSSSSSHTAATEAASMKALEMDATTAMLSEFTTQRSFN